MASFMLDKHSTAEILHQPSFLFSSVSLSSLPPFIPSFHIGHWIQSYAYTNTITPSLAAFLALVPLHTSFHFYLCAYVCCWEPGCTEISLMPAFKSSGDVQGGGTAVPHGNSRLNLSRTTQRVPICGCITEVASCSASWPTLAISSPFIAVVQWVWSVVSLWFGLAFP